jgi:hypothetical protein
MYDGPVLLSLRHQTHGNLMMKGTEFSSHIKVTTALLGFVTYRFRNQNVNWQLNVST